MKVKIEESWRRRLQEEFDKPYFERLVAFVHEEYARAQVLPKGSQIFHIFDACPFEKVKVVILGQDPYPTPGQYTAFVFLCPMVWRYRLLWRIYSGRFIRIWISLYLHRVISTVGSNKVFFP